MQPQPTARRAARTPSSTTKEQPARVHAQHRVNDPRLEGNRRGILGPSYRSPDGSGGASSWAVLIEMVERKRQGKRGLVNNQSYGLLSSVAPDMKVTNSRPGAPTPE